LLSAVNIRLPLQGHSFSKSQRRLLARNDKRFRVTIGKIRITKEKQRLYDEHKERFKAFIHETLEEVVRGFSAHRYFNTQEVCVYEGRKLVAISYFDVGYKATASILCVYDKHYPSSSLGIYTMLKEIEFAQNHGIQYYYPGYVMDLPGSFDYKLRIGEVEWLTAQHVWKPWNTFSAEQTKAHEVREMTARLERWMESKHVPYRKKLYPYYSAGHLMQTDMHLLRYPIFLEWEDKGQRKIVAYDCESKQYIGGTIKESPEFVFMLNSNYSKEYRNAEVYELGMFVFENFYVFEIEESYSQTT
jgi:arginine-tRNA-protein transferase